MAECTSFGIKLVFQISVHVTKAVLVPVVLQGPSLRSVLLIVVRSVWPFLWAEGLFYVQEWWSAWLCAWPLMVVADPSASH